MENSYQLTSFKMNWDCSQSVTPSSPGHYSKEPSRRFQHLGATWCPRRIWAHACSGDSWAACVSVATVPLVLGEMEPERGGGWRRQSGLHWPPWISLPCPLAREGPDLAHRTWQMPSLSCACWQVLHLYLAYMWEINISNNFFWRCFYIFI